MTGAPKSNRTIPMPRPPQRRWWHRFAPGKAARHTTTPRSGLGGALLAFGVVLTALATITAFFMLSGGFTVPALVWAALPLGLLLCALGWLLMRTIEMRLSSGFFGLLGALGLHTAIGPPGLQTVSARLGTGAVDLTLAEQTSAASAWALVAALALVLVAIWVNRRA